MNRDDIVLKLEEAISDKTIDWGEVELLIESLGENINDISKVIADEPETILSNLYGYIEMEEGYIG